MNRYTKHTAECEPCRRAVGTADTLEGARQVLREHWRSEHATFAVGTVRSDGPECVRLMPVHLGWPVR